MDLAIIERLMQLLQNSEVNELEVSEGNLHIRMSKSVGGATVAPSSAQAVDTAEPVREPAAEAGKHVLAAGLPGTFYRSPSPDAEPFVSIGDPVSDGQQVGIVEAMKMMNPVEADCDGEILEILAADGAPVMAGTPLVAVRRTVL